MKIGFRHVVGAVLKGWSPPPVFFCRSSPPLFFGLLPIRAGLWLSPAVLLGTACAEVLRHQGIQESSRPPRDPIRFRWRKELTESPPGTYRPEEFATPEIDPSHRRLFVGSNSGTLRAFTLEGGREIWDFKTEGRISSQPLYLGSLETVFAGSDDGNLYALSAKDGRKRWSYQTAGMVRRQPVFSDGLLFFAASPDHLYAVDPETGRSVWNFSQDRVGMKIDGESGVTVGGGRLFCGFSDGLIIAFELKTGELLWRKSLGNDGPDAFNDIDGLPVYDEVRRLLFVTSRTEGIWALDPKNGETVWHHPLEGAGDPVISFGRLFVPWRGGLASLNPSTGERNWNNPIRAGTLSRPVRGGSHLFVTASEGGLFGIDPSTGRIELFFPPGGGISGSPVVKGSDLFFISNWGYLYAAEIHQ
ncbi:MAG: PQQ-binding-like beta-propeller repeat protein [Deltaproteobacteria bacterium]|nr:PQQ-binding-like beta-propeller repeat protein [Deltaproteobacteria bacterium]MBI4374492.1 PQQ-binding-like beta-propeller repeat protein [Deltaproteobacteria bacterium]